MQVCCFCLEHREDFQPISVGILNIIEVRFGFFQTDTAHFSVFLQSAFKIFGAESKMHTVVAKIVRLFFISEPGEFNCVLGVSIAHKNKLKAAVGSIVSSDGLKAKGIVIELDAAVKIRNVKVVVKIV